MLPLSSPMAWDLIAAPYASDVVPFFTQFAEHALRLAGVAAGAAIVDVASGPGRRPRRCACRVPRIGD